MSRFAINPYRARYQDWDDTDDSIFGSDDVLRVHQSLPEYGPTPTYVLRHMARTLGVKQILVKDESRRFGLKAFKALGASYAVYRFIKRVIDEPDGRCPDASHFYQHCQFPAPDTFTFCTATDGNHGRGVAWVARKLRQRAVIYMPADSVRARIESIRSEGAEVVIVDGTYDDAVTRSAADAEANGWQIISDTSWQGYEEIPRWIMAGYTTMFREIHESASGPENPDIVIIQAGVGALAAAAAWYYNRVHTGSPTRLVSVEPTDADCLLESIRSSDGEPTPSRGAQHSIMAGLNCGTPSLVAWPIVKRGFDLFLSVPDDYSIIAMRSYYYPKSDDPRIVSGESGAAGLAALIAMIEEDPLAPAREHLHLDSESTVLLLNTEGATDPAQFNRLVRENH